MKADGLAQVADAYSGHSHIPDACVGFVNFVMACSDELCGLPVPNLHPAEA